MSLSDIFVDCKLEVALKFGHWFPRPSYHPKNKEVVIISPGQLEGNKKGIYEFNLIKNTFTKIHTYKQGFNPSRHGQFIDSKNELLYIFGNGQSGIFDLNTNILNTNTQSALRDCNECPQSTYIPSPINEYHILTYDSTHYKMDMNNKNINKMKS
eukprot:400661_1